MPVSKFRLNIPRYYLQTLRKGVGIKRADFAKALGVATSTIIRLENGSCDLRKKTADIIQPLMADKLGVSLEQLQQFEYEYMAQAEEVRSKALDEHIELPTMPQSERYILCKKILADPKLFNGLTNILKKVVIAVIAENIDIATEDLANRLNITTRNLWQYLAKLRKKIEESD